MLRPSPLRTVLASFPAHGSSLSNALETKTQFSNRNIPVMNLSVAIGMKKNPVFCLVAAAFGSFHEVMIVPTGLWGDLLIADWTETVLLLPQMKQLSFACEGCVHLSAETLL